MMMMVTAIRLIENFFGKQNRNQVKDKKSEILGGQVDCVIVPGFLMRAKINTRAQTRKTISMTSMVLRLEGEAVTHFGQKLNFRIDRSMVVVVVGRRKKNRIRMAVINRFDPIQIDP